MTILTALLVSVFSLQSSVPPDSVGLEYCQQQAAQNYPTAKNIDLQRKITALSVKIAHSGYFPEIDMSGKATYQTEVTSFSVPGIKTPPPVSKDQYEASAEVTQTIFNAGAVGIRKSLQQARGASQIHATEVSLHQIRSQVNQVYYGILLSRQQAKTTGLLLKNLRSQLKTVHSKVQNGVLLSSQEDVLRAQMLKAKQDSGDTAQNVIAGYNVLSQLVGKSINPQEKLKLPDTQVNYQALEPQRPEYAQFKSQQKVLDEQKKLANTSKFPRISAFGTASYGRPGLNFLNDNFHDYYIVGLRLEWNFWDAFNAGREAQTLKLQQQQIAQHQRAFTRQLNASLDRISQRIIAIQKKMKQDRKIIKLRAKVVNESSSQLKNGVLTATEYVTVLTRANEARLAKYIHRVQLAQAKTQYLTTLGIPTIE